MSTRLLGIAIALLLAGAVAAAIVKGVDEGTVAIQPTPTQTFTFDGPPPVETETPIVPTDTTSPAGTGTEPGATGTETEPEPTESPELPLTGAGSLAGPALMSFALALVAGAAVRRTSRAKR